MGSSHQMLEHVPLAATAAIISIGIKEWLFRETVKVGEETNSNLLIANAWHHRSDAYSSIVALLGISGAYIGIPILDPIAGLFVASLSKYLYRFNIKSNKSNSINLNSYKNWI